MNPQSDLFQVCMSEMCFHISCIYSCFLLLDAILSSAVASPDGITCLLSAGQGVALSAESTEWPSVLYIHTAGAPGPHTAERASLTDDNTEREGCIGEDSPPPRHLGDKQGNETNRKKKGLIMKARTGASYREAERERQEKKEERIWMKERDVWTKVKSSRRGPEASFTKEHYSPILCLQLKPSQS